jgi:hypothetical protein
MNNGRVIKLLHVYLLSKVIAPVVIVYLIIILFHLHCVTPNMIVVIQTILELENIVLTMVPIKVIVRVLIGRGGRAGNQDLRIVTGRVIQFGERVRRLVTGHNRMDADILDLVMFVTRRMYVMTDRVVLLIMVPGRGVTPVVIGHAVLPAVVPVE